jgi:hypothetical protein
MTAERHDRWNYYRCSRQSYRRELCGAKFCNADRAHTDIAGICGRIQLNREIADAVQQSCEQVIRQRHETLLERFEQSRQQQAGLLETEMRLTDGFATGALSSDVYKARVAEIRTQRAELNRVAEREAVPPDQLAQAVSHILAMATSLWDLYEQFDDWRRADLLRVVFKTVVLDERGVIGMTLKPPFDQLLTQATGSLERTTQSLLQAAGERVKP